MSEPAWSTSPPGARSRNAADRATHVDDLRSTTTTLLAEASPREPDGGQRSGCCERAARETDPLERKRLQDEVVVLHMGLARAIAARYRGRGIADDDLTQAASMALLKAARNFDADRWAWSSCPTRSSP